MQAEPGSPRYAAASPITYVDRTDPPTLLVNSTHEIVPIEQALELAHKLEKARVPNRLLELPGSRHATASEESAWPATLRFLQRHLNHWQRRPSLEC
ncbi:MAG: hypothetical protein E6G64_11210 [Actinobacteria bacterium]|nr:MAG: hypothetical protein E6G64_11210 [Actinomycetota bacterium]